jgi:hypothetical protein
MQCSGSRDRKFLGGIFQAVDRLEMVSKLPDFAKNLEKGAFWSNFT